VLLSDGRTAFRARFSAYGVRRKTTLGYSPDWDLARAEDELAFILAQVRRGVWKPPPNIAAPSGHPAPAALPATEPTMRVVLSQFMHHIERGKAPRTAAAYRSEIVNHLGPFFHADLPSQVTVARVLAYREHEEAQFARLRELRSAGIRTDAQGEPLLKGLAPVSLNKTVERLIQCLEWSARVNGTVKPVALREAAAAGDLYLPERGPDHSFLELDHVLVLLEAAVELDAEARADREHLSRHAALATFCLAGVRITEFCLLNVGDVDFAAGVLHIRGRGGRSKTVNGVRDVPLGIFLAAILGEHIARHRAAAHGAEPLFPTSTGRRQGKDNVARRIIGSCMALARELWVRRDPRSLNPLPDRVTASSFRRTYITHRLELTKNPRAVQDEVGHADAAFTMAVYAKVSRYNRSDPRLPAMYATPGDAAPVSPTEAARARAALLAPAPGLRGPGAG
jgi:integrase